MKKLKYKDASGEYQDLYKVYKEDPFNGYDYIDMGEAGYWATCSVGASKPEETGLYFAWGEIKGYADTNGDKKFSYDDYKFEGYETGNQTKYNLTDGLRTLELEDDAAHVNMGGSWRMPTKDEFQKLYNLCNIEWTEDYEETGIKGRIFKLKTDESKQLFFPAAGYCAYGLVKNVGSDGMFWSSSLGLYYQCGCGLGFNSSDAVIFDQGNRCQGVNVRGFIPKSE